MSVTAQAKERQYNVKEFQHAYARYLELSDVNDPKKLRQFADSVRLAGRKSGNYRVEMLYYNAMNSAMLIDGTPDSIRVAILDKAQKRARELGSDMLYWRNYSSKVVEYIYIDPVKALDMAEDMLKEAKKTSSTIGLMHSYYALGYTYAMRGETMMAVSVLEKAAALGEANKDDAEIENDLYFYIYDLLAQCYSAVPAFDKALRIYDKMEQHALSGKSNNALNIQGQIFGIDAARAQIYFDDERYGDFDRLLKKMRRNSSFDTMLNSGDYEQLRLCVLLHDGKDHEAWQMIQEVETADEKHNFLYVYYKYRKDYGQAMKEWEAMQMSRDSALYQARLSDMESMDAKIGNVELRNEKDRLKRRQQMIVMSASAFVLLLIVIFLVVLYVRNRKHTKVLTEKNVQLDIARKDAEKSRDEAEVARDEAEQARDEAVRANKVKTHFIQNMTHEIHTPLNAINGFTQVLCEPSMQGMFGQEELMEMYKSIGDSAMNLSSLVDNIITITDSESTQERAVIRPVKLQALIDTTMAEGKQPDDTAAVNYHCDLSALPEEFTILTNEGLLKQILDKLLNNAVKFTKQGEICVTAAIDEDYVVDSDLFETTQRTAEGAPEASPLTDNKGVLLLSIRDTGPGIPEGKEELIFERFKKLDEYVPGTGLGLSVCRALAPRIYSQVYCDMTQTKEGQGSVFTIRIPLHTAPFEAKTTNFSYNEMLGCY